MLCSRSQIEVSFPQGSLEGVPQGTKLIAILDEDWPQFLAEENCMVRDRLNRWLVPLDEPETARDGDATFRTTIRQVHTASFSRIIAASLLLCWFCCRRQPSKRKYRPSRNVRRHDNPHVHNYRQRAMAMN